MFLPRSDRRKFLRDEWKHLLRRSPVDQAHHYAFHHIPKCAGTSARVALEQWFVNVLDYHKPWSDQLDQNYMADYKKHPLELNRLKARHLLIGHYNLPEIFIGKRYPELFENEKYRVITFLRDPLELQLSLHHYEIREGMIPKGTLAKDRLFLRPNYIASSLPCNEENWQEVMDRYWFVGITENLQKSFDQLSEKLNKPRIRIPVLNTTKRNDSELISKDLEEFQELNALDYRIYEYSMNKYRDELSVS